MTNRMRGRYRAALLGALLGLGLGLGFTWMWGPAWGATAVYVVRSLVPSSPDDFAQLTVAHVQATQMMPNGTPQVLVSRRVTAAELPCLGLDPIYVEHADEPLVLVVLKGDFALTDRLAPVIVTPSGFHYLTYVYIVRDHAWTSSSAFRDPLPLRPLLGDAAVAPPGGPPLPPLPPCTPNPTLPGVQPTSTVVPVP